MRKFHVKIDQESDFALKELSNSSIQFLYSPAAEVNLGSSIIAVQNISIQISDKKFVVVEAEWAQTPIEWIDYYFFRARIADRPKEVTVNGTEKDKKWTYNMDHLSFQLGKRMPIYSIEVIEDKETGENEEVLYDAGIVITLDDNTKLTIVRQHSCCSLLQTATLPHDNKELCGALKTRTKYNV